jgi:1-phosphatidylinositol phosphodiesterase
VKTAHSKKVYNSAGKKAVEEPRIRGWAFMDFYEDPVDAGVVPLLVECNFRGRKIGEEGWN